MKLKGKPTRVDYYRATWYPDLHYFSVGPDLISQDFIKFPYVKNGEKTEKIVDTHYWMNNLVKPTTKKRIYWDEKLMQRMYRGEFYMVDEDAIFNY